MVDPKTKIKEEKPTEEVYDSSSVLSILADLQELLDDKEEYRP